MTKSLNKQKESSVEGEVVAVNTWVRLPTLWFWGLRFFWRMARLPHPLTNIFRQLKAHTQIHTAALSLISARTTARLQIQLLSSSNTHSPFGSSKFNLVKWSMKMLKQIYSIVKWGSHAFHLPFNIHSFIFINCFILVRVMAHPEPILRDNGPEVEIYPSPSQSIIYAHIHTEKQFSKAIPPTDLREEEYPLHHVTLSPYTCLSCCNSPICICYLFIGGTAV